MIGAVVRDAELVFARDLPERQPHEDDVVFEMEATCISRLDLQIARGGFPSRPPAPYIPGLDGAGRVISGLRTHPPGTRVWIRGEGVGTTRDGCCAERVIVPEGALHDLREDVDAVTAATFFVPCAASYAALHDVGRLQAGESVGVRGAAGAVGQVAVQMALAGGAREVIAIVAAADRTQAVPRGARIVVAAGPDEIAAELSGAEIDLLVDTVAGPGLAACLPAMRVGGRIVLVGYVGGERLELRTTELLVRDVSLLPVNNFRRTQAAVLRSREWLDALECGELFLPTSAYPVERLAEATTAVVGSPSPGRVAVLFRQPLSA